MGWRFRKSFSPLPGVRLTLSPSGISTSVGIGPLRLTAGPRGTALTANVPGTGLSYRQPFTAGPPPPSSLSPAPIPSPAAESQASPFKNIKSAASTGLTTPGLGEFKRLLQQARLEQIQISHELTGARTREQAAVRKYNSWKDGWLLRRIFKTKFQQIAATSEEASAYREELEEQERQARLQTQIEMPQAVAQAFHLMCDEFSLLAKAARIWDTVGQRSTNRITERTTASRIIERKPVSFRLGKCELIEAEWLIPHMANANGGDLFLFPGFVLYFVSSEAFALMEYKEIRVTYTSTRFIEDEPIPPDSKVVGQTWAKTNKDGSPDRRFKDNYQIPVVQYGKLVLTSTTGMNEEYMISNVEQTESFLKAWKQLVSALDVRA